MEASGILRARPEATSAEVAALVGISGIGTFFRTFRRVHGMSPKAFRHDSRPPFPPRESNLAPFPDALRHCD